MILVAELGDRDAADEFHHEVGPARFGLAAVEDMGDVGMVHERERLPLGFEAGDDLPGIHARLEQLECDSAAHRPRLLGREHHAEPAFADRFEQLVRTDDRSATFPHRLIHRFGASRWFVKRTEFSLSAEEFLNADFQ